MVCSGESEFSSFGRYLTRQRAESDLDLDGKDYVLPFACRWYMCNLFLARSLLLHAIHCNTNNVIGKALLGQLRLNRTQSNLSHSFGRSLSLPFAIFLFLPFTCTMIQSARLNATQAARSNSTGHSTSSLLSYAQCE